MKKFFTVLGAFPALIPVLLCAQENDFGMWNTFNFECKLNRKFSLLATEEFRLKENLNRVNLFYTDVGVSYKISRNLKIAPVYRFIQKARNNEQYGLRHRLMLDITYKTGFSFITFSTRTRLQGELVNPGVSELGYVPEYYWRQKFDLKFNINSPRFTPYVGAELRIQFSNPHIKEFRDFGFSRTRTYAGCDYRLNRNSAFGIYYLVQNDYQVNDPTTLYVLGLEYGFTLDFRNKNPKESPGE